MADAPAPRKSGRALGGQLAMSVLVGGALGYGLDILFDWPHWGLIVGILLGFCAWCWEMWQLIK